MNGDVVGGLGSLSVVDGLYRLHDVRAHLCQLTARRPEMP